MTKNIEEKVNFETAEQEFIRFAEIMDIDIDTEKMSEGDLESFEENKNILVKAIQKGSLVINENGEPVYTPRRGKDQVPLTFHEPTGEVMMALDKGTVNQNVLKLFDAMGRMTKTSKHKFLNMSASDIKVCRTIAIFFLV